MKKLTKIVIMLVFLAICVVFFASCHGNKPYEAFEIPEEFDTNKQYNIVFWAKNEKNIRQTEVYKAAIAEFEKLYPNINVTMKLYSDYSIIYRDVITNVATQTTPNVCISYPDHIATYMTGKNVVVPLDDLLFDEKFGLGGSEIKFDAPTAKEIVPQFLSEGVIKGVQYAVPFMRSTEALYYNKDYVEQIAIGLGYDGIPEVITWDFVWEVSEAALAKNEDGTFVINGQKKLIPFVYKSTDNMMIQMLKQNGGEYSNEAGDLLIFNDTTRQLLHTFADHAESGAFSTFSQVSYPADLLNRGQCIFAIDSTAGSVWMGKNGPLAAVDEDEAINYELAVSMIPQVSEDVKPVMISQGPSICLFNKEDSGEVLASWIFIQYLLSNDMQIAYSQTEGYVPVTLKAQQSSEYQDYLSRANQLDADGDNYLYYGPKIAASKILLENAENTFITPVFNGSASLRMASGEMIEQVIDAVTAKPKRIVDDAFIDNLFEHTVSLYHLDGIGIQESIENNEILPISSILLLSSIGAIWLGIVGYIVGSTLISQKKKKNSASS